MEIIYSNSNNNKYFKNRSFTSFIGEASDLSTIVNDMTELTIKKNAKVKKLVNNIDFINMLGLSPDILKSRLNEISYSEYKLILLIYVCEMHPDLVILNNLDLGLNHKDKSKISKFIKLINAEYKTSFLIISNDILFLNRISKHLIIAKNKIIKYQGDIISAIKSGLVSKPPIIEFIELANEKGANLTYTLDNKELLKDIYRSIF